MAAETTGRLSLNPASPPNFQQQKQDDIPSDVVYAGREICGELCLAEAREYLLTNGIGGYASMTLANSLTRSYHGLLIAALRPPLDRTLLLSKLNETILYLDKTFHLATDRRKALSANEQPYSATSSAQNSLPLSAVGHAPLHSAAIYENPASSSPVWRKSSISTDKTDVKEDEIITSGFELLESFRLEGTVPVFTYSFADALLEKKIWMKRGQNTVYVTYYLKRAVQAIELRINALVNHRNHHARTSAANPHFNYSANVGRNGNSVAVLFTTADSQETTLSMIVSRGRAELTNEWLTGFVLSEERARGLPEIDDNLHAATFVVDLPPGGLITFAATTDMVSSQVSLDGESELAMQHAYEKSLLQKFEEARFESRKHHLANDGNAVPVEGIQSPCTISSHTPISRERQRRRCLEPRIKQLVLAADQFIISRGGGRSVVAGFHWFTDWARDTMIALPGLTIATGRYDVARSVLQTFSKYVSQGMLPNRFPDDGSAPTESDYDNADGTLWYFEAIRSYYKATRDVELVIELYPILRDIISYHCEGTRFGIKQDSDGLLQAGVENLALTWMDAKTDVCYTQRDGKAVELAALWFNALNCMSFFAAIVEHEEESDAFTEMADKTERSFQEKFWNAEVGYCYDVIDGGVTKREKDSSLRPNQLVAASLNWSPLTEEQRFLVVEACSTHLLTSNAIRTLSPDDEKYKGVYLGDIYARDSAYHQGVGWVWLLGPFILAHLRVFGNKETSREFLLPILRSHLNDAGVGQVSELFDGDPPHRARGCIAQAWSVAELLRAWVATEPDEAFLEE